MADLTPLQWLWLGCLGIAGMLLHSAWAWRATIGAWLWQSATTVGSVARYVAPAVADGVATRTDHGPSVRPSAPSVAVRAAEALQRDRSRQTLVTALVAAGWSTAEIRDRLVGANDAIGAEVKAARAALGLDDGAAVTPIAGRPVPPGVSFE